MFPVQTTIIPQILQKQLYGSDLCVCAPTGSGKTLAYVIPIVQDLMSRIVPRLRALVIVPTRDLVSQVSLFVFFFFFLFIDFIYCYC